MTMIGYFQLFAEPYVMTQGGPGGQHAQRRAPMYEEGFRWWNLGYAAAIAFVLFADHARRRPCCSCALRRARRGERHEPAPRARCSCTALLVAAARARRSLPLLWMLSASLMPAGEASALPAALCCRARRRSSTTARCSRASTSARYFAQQPARSRRSVTLLSLVLQLAGRLRLRQAALSPAATRIFRLLLARARDPGAGRRCCRSS